MTDAVLKQKETEQYCPAPSRNEAKDNPEFSNITFFFFLIIAIIFQTLDTYT